MKLSFVRELRKSHFLEKLVVFNPETGRTHCLDASVEDVLDFAQTHDLLDEDSFVAQFSSFIGQSNNSVLQQYLHGMINQLIDLELITLIRAS